jgi:hypothetical protein
MHHQWARHGVQSLAYLGGTQAEQFAIFCQERKPPLMGNKGRGFVG